METGVTARVADASEIGAVAETLAGAFFNDPVWGWAFDDPARRHDQHVALVDVVRRGEYRAPVGLDDAPLRGGLAVDPARLPRTRGTLRGTP